MTITKMSRSTGEELAGAHTPRGWRTSAVPGGQLLDRVRDALGRAHYDRMRRGMEPALRLPFWSDLDENSREAYRQRTDYLVSGLLDLIEAERRDAADDRQQQLVDERI